jgi:phosphatidylglycerophosphate synthase
MTAQTWTRRPLKTRDHNWAIRVAQWLAAAQVSPNSISLASVLSASAAAWALAVHAWLLAALFIQLRLLCNLLDGMVAVEGGRRSALGEIYNDLPDRVSDGLILVAAGYGAAWPTLGWLAALLAVMTAYVRVMGGACGLAQDFSGPMAKPHRMAVLTVACLAAVVDVRAIAAGLGLIVAGAAVTAARRTVVIARQLGGRVR